MSNDISKYFPQVALLQDYQSEQQLPNPHEDLSRLAADSPMVIVTPNLMAEIERAAKPNPSRPWVGKPSLEHMLPPDTDGIPTSFVSIACSNADRKIKGLCKRP